MISATPTIETVIDVEQEKRDEEIYTSRLLALGDLTQPLSEKDDALLLRPYQVEGVKFLLKNQFAILGDDMGLGKTIQTLSLLQREWKGSHKRPVLLICPTSVVGNWSKEAARFCGVQVGRGRQER